MVDREPIREHHPVMLARRSRGDEFLLHVRAHRYGVALERIAPAAAAAGAHDHLGAHWHRVVRPARDAKFALARLAHEIHAVFARLAAPQAPRRALVSAHELEIPFPFDQVAHAHIDAEAAAIFPRTAGIRAQRAALDQNRAFELDAFDRTVAHVALAHRHRAGLAVFERPAAPAAPFDALHDEAPVGLRMDAEEHHRAAEQTVVTRRHPLRHRRGVRELIAARRSGEQPDRSMVIAPLWMVTLARMGTGSPRVTPSSSRAAAAS